MAQDYKASSELVKNLVVTGSASLSSGAVEALSERYVATANLFGPWCNTQVVEPFTFTRTGKNVIVTVPPAIANANGTANAVVNTVANFSLPDAGWLPNGMALFFNNTFVASVPVLLADNVSAGTLFYNFIPGDRANNSILIETASGGPLPNVGNSGVLGTSFSYSTI